MLMLVGYLALWPAAALYFQSLRSQARWLPLVSRLALVLCLGFLSIGLVQRALASGHWPFSTPYEFTLCFLWFILALYLLFELSWGRWAGVFVIAVALLVGAYALTRPASAREIAPLLPVLRSVWLQVHVLCLLIAYGAFGLAAGLGLMRLAAYRPDDEDEVGARLPAPGEVVKMAERAVALGFPWLTLGILTGAIWAQNAWGRYWGWDPKEVWALATWLWYLLVLHVRALRKWRDQRLAWLIVAGFGIVLFSLIGLPWLVRTVRLESLHGF
jgi:cytochrome c-type biogenesis protein CcsB